MGHHPEGPGKAEEMGPDEPHEVQEGQMQCFPSESEQLSWSNRLVDEGGKQACGKQLGSSGH